MDKNQSIIDRAWRVHNACKCLETWSDQAEEIPINSQYLSGVFAILADETERVAASLCP